jgi:hypothetical protein
LAFRTQLNMKFLSLKGDNHRLSNIQRWGFNHSLKLFIECVHTSIFPEVCLQKGISYVTSLTLQTHMPLSRNKILFALYRISEPLISHNFPKGMKMPFFSRSFVFGLYQKRVGNRKETCINVIWQTYDIHYFLLTLCC